MLSQTKLPVTFPGQERGSIYLPFASNTPASREIIEAINKELGSPFDKLNIIVSVGLQDARITIEYLNRLFIAESMPVGSTTYQGFLDLVHSIKVNDTSISVEDFNKYAAMVKTACDKISVSLHTKQIIAFISALYFVDCQVKVVLYEIGFESLQDPVYLGKIKILAIPCLSNVFDNQECERYMIGVDSQTHVITAEQARICISKLKEKVLEKGGIWEMPIRKFPVTKYVFHNLYSHAMGLAERVGLLFANINTKGLEAQQTSLFIKKEVARGRPRIEQKRSLEGNRDLTLEQFWLTVNPVIQAHTELKSFKNNDYLIHHVNNIYDIIKVLSAIKLLNYQNNYTSIIVGIKIPISVSNEDLDILFKELRYFSKKMVASSFVWLGQASRIQPFEMMYQIPVAGVFTIEEFKSYAEEKFQGSKKLIVFAGSDDVVKDIYSYNL